MTSGFFSYLDTVRELGLHEVTKGYRFTVRGRGVKEVLNWSFTSAIIGVYDGLPKLWDLNEYAEAQVGSNLAGLELFGWIAVIQKMIGELGPVFMGDPTTRQARILNDKSHLQNGSLTPYPACWSVVQVQVRRALVYVSAYARSVDVALFPIDIGYLIYSGRYFTDYGPTESTGIQVAVHVANLHRYIDGGGSDGGLDTTRLPVSE